mgnify:CR=1 FL=1
MNRKEWKSLCKVNTKAAYYWYNRVRKLLKSREYESLDNCDKDATVVHHLRDTEEQRKHNDEHYEMFGFEIDENGNEHFEYGKYVVFWTKEHHNEYHRLSEETRKRISESNKGRYVSEETRKKLREANKGKYIHDDQRKQISESVSNLWKSEEYRERQSKATKEAMWRPDVRQRMLDGCKKRPPISEEARKRAAEANRGKHHSDETKNLLSINKREYYRKLHIKQANEFDFNLELSKLKKHACRKYGLCDESTQFIFDSILSYGDLDKCNNASTSVEAFNMINKTLSLKWNIFQSIFFSIRKLFIRSIFYEQYK